MSIPVAPRGDHFPIVLAVNAAVGSLLLFDLDW
jgi:hypothetical protein